MLKGEHFFLTAEVLDDGRVEVLSFVPFSITFSILIREESESEFNWSNDCLLNNQVATEIDMAIQLKSLTFMDVFPIEKTGVT